MGLSGPIGSGKSTAAQALMRVGYTKMALAQPLKQMIVALLTCQGMPYEEAVGLTEDPSKKELPRIELAGWTPRHTMQTLGTEWGREHMGQDFWVSCWKRSIADMELVVVDDVRFRNEAHAIIGLGGMLINLWRPDQTHPLSTHPSEMQELPFTNRVDNSGTISELTSTILHLAGVR